MSDAAELLRKAADGRDEYAAALDGSDNRRLIEQRELLRVEASVLRRAARVVDGDLGPMFGWLPSWRWTDEMTRRGRGRAVTPAEPAAPEHDTESDDVKGS